MSTVAAAPWTGPDVILTRTREPVSATGSGRTGEMSAAASSAETGPYSSDQAATAARRSG